MHQRKCFRCGCTDERACVNRRTGNTCSWWNDNLCSFCWLKVWGFMSFARTRGARIVNVH
jgi:hypothetical protein